MKTTYRVQGLPEISKSLSFLQPKAKEELFEALGFCDPRSASSPTRKEDEAGNVVGEFFRPVQLTRYQVFKREE